ncbi:MAG TPA: DegT/DnrJ/EryC1/StrS family aminotransferase [Candidatus Nitrosocosmicus sp.]|nr:DegT/DnrJ/EryC1/StrS family aminotransferase [Candidatus Nitrosocosmicus sp.]
MIKLFEPNVTEEEVIAAVEVIKSKNWASGAGSGKVKEFEDKFNSYIGSKEAVAVNSGTAALHLALSLYDVKNKVVFVPSLSFVSTAHAVLYNGGIPVFVDVKQDTLCMDPEDLKEKVRTTSGNLAAVIPVHFGGMSSDIDSILKICEVNSMHLLDDAAHICGGKFHGKKIGTFGEMTCFSFHPVKNLSMPTGGAITLNMNSSENAKKKLSSLRWCGIDNRKGTFYDVTSVSPNYYMNEISAAIGLAQLTKLDILNRKRVNIAKKYCSNLTTEKKMQFDEDCVYHLYWIEVETRDNFIKYMQSKGIEVGTHYRPIHTMSAYRQFDKGKLPVTNDVGEKIVTLPIHPNLNDDQVGLIIETTNSYDGGNG